MSKRVLRGLLASIIIIIVVLVYMSINTSIKAFDDKEAKNYKYHFQVIVDKDMDKSSRSELIQGCLKSGMQHNVYIEVIEAIDNDNKEELIDKAIYAKVDGIAYNVEAQSIASDLSKKAKSVDIPVVNYGMSGNRDNNIVNIHTSPYVISGIIASRIKSDIKKFKFSNKDKVLVILKECSDKDKMINNKISKGFLKGISSKYKNNVKFVRVNAEGYDINSKLKSQIKKNKKAKIVVCFDEDYTNVTSAIYSEKYKGNLEKNIMLYGYGMTDNNKENVQSGYIKTLFNVKYFSLGYNAVGALVDMKKSNDIDIQKFSPLFQVIELDSNKELVCKDSIIIKE